MMEKIILFYKFVPVPDPETTMHWQRSLASAHGLKGRIIVSKHGINGTLGGRVDGLKQYVKAMKAHPSFKATQFKWSKGGADDFPKLSVKVRPEIVTFGLPDEVVVDESGVVGGGKHVSPEQVHKLAEKFGDDLVFMDGRNAYEAEIGRFKGAVVPDTKTTKDFIEELENPEMQKLKDKHVVTYCTGGIRCEILSSLMKKRGYKNVYQIKGGIHKYGEKFKDDGLWEGKMYVFDKRMNVAFSEKAKDIGECGHCGSNTSQFKNCGYDLCSKLQLICDSCASEGAFCNQTCEKAQLSAA